MEADRGVNADEITLTLPCEAPFYRVANLVLGGLAARLDLTLETLEDLQIALNGLLERAGCDGDVTVVVRVGEGAIETAVGPVREDALLSELAEVADEGIGLRRILDTVVDGVEVHDRSGEQWVELTKNVRPVDGRR